MCGNAGQLHKWLVSIKFGFRSKDQVLDCVELQWPKAHNSTEIEFQRCKRTISWKTLLNSGECNKKNWSPHTLCLMCGPKLMHWKGFNSTTFLDCGCIKQKWIGPQLSGCIQWQGSGFWTMHPRMIWMSSQIWPLRSLDTWKEPIHDKLHRFLVLEEWIMTSPPQHPCKLWWPMISPDEMAMWCPG